MLDVFQDPLTKRRVDRSEMRLQDRINDRRVFAHQGQGNQDRSRSGGKLDNSCEGYRVALNAKSHLRHVGVRVGLWTTRLGSRT